MQADYEVPFPHISLFANAQRNSDGMLIASTSPVLCFIAVNMVLAPDHHGQDALRPWQPRCQDDKHLELTRFLL